MAIVSDGEPVRHGVGKRQKSAGELTSVTWSGLLGSGGSLRTWQVRIFLCIYIGYASCYVGKQSFNGLVQAVLADPTSGLDVAAVGLVGSATAFGYTAGKVISTLLLDSLRVRTLFPSVILGIGLANVAFAFSTNTTAYVLFWGINGVLQGLSWVSRRACDVLYVTNVYPATLCPPSYCVVPRAREVRTPALSLTEDMVLTAELRARWWGIVSTCGTLSSGVSQIAFPQLCAWLAGYDLGWRTAMLLGSMFPLVLSLVVTVWLQDSPNDVGLNWEPQLLGGVKKSDNADVLPMVTRLKIVWTSWEVQLLSVASLLVYIVRTAVNNWLAVFLRTEKGYSALAAGSALFWFEIGGAVGATFAGWSTYLPHRLELDVR